MKTKPLFASRPRFIALGRAAVKQPQIPTRGERHTQRFWGRSACPPAISSGGTKPNTSIPKHTCPSWMRRCLPHYYRRGQRVYLIQDNASFHKETWKFWSSLPNTAGRSRCSSLPPYSPDFNATERLWHYTRKESTHNRYFDRPARAMPIAVHNLHRHAAPPGKNPRLLVPFF